jgi:hypothetical protein
VSLATDDDHLGARPDAIGPPTSQQATRHEDDSKVERGVDDARSNVTATA